MELTRILAGDCRARIPWRGLYRGGLDLVTPESNRHPAKMSWALCAHILKHLEELGLLRTGDTVLDMMAGTGRTAIVAGAKGYRAVTLELEPQWVEMSRANKAYAERKLGRALDWTILQGDARNLTALLAERGLCAVALTSPPYDGNVSASKSDPHPARQQSVPAGRIYGTSNGQLGAETGDDYKSAMLQVYQQAAQVCKVLVVVTKNPTRKGRLLPLHRTTARLLKAAGFRVVDYHRAMLWEEQEQNDLFGENHKRPRGRMSFFKRLSYEKGAPVAKWEDVLFAVSALAGKDA